MKRTKLILANTLITLFVLGCVKEKPTISLEGPWKLRVGDQSSWSDPSLNDQDWVEYQAPGNFREKTLEEKGGFVWLRKEFEVSSVITEPMALELGVIADADETFVDGLRVGKTGEFPPNERSAFHIRRAYLLPDQLLTPGKHMVAIRVYKLGGRGIGILEGPVGISNYDRALRAASLHRIVRSDLLLAASFAMLFIGLYHAFVAFFRRKDAQYQTFANLAVFVAIYMAGVSFRLPEIFGRHMVFLKLGMIGPYLAIHYLLRFVRSSQRKPVSLLDRVSLSAAVIFSAATIFTNNQAHAMRIHSVWFPILLSTLLYTGKKLYDHFSLSEAQTKWAVIGPFVLLITAVIHDVWITLFHVTGLILNPYAFMGFVIGISLFLAKDYSGAIADRSLKVEVEKENQELKFQIEMDEVTGLLNRKSFIRQVSREIKIARAQATSLCLAIIEIDQNEVELRIGDNLKDQLRREVAWILRETGGETTVLSYLERYRFGILFKGSNEEDSIELSRSIRQRVASFPFTQKASEQSKQITASIGVSTLSEKAGSVEALFESCELALRSALKIGNTVFSNSFQREHKTSGIEKHSLLRLVFNKDRD